MGIRSQMRRISLAVQHRDGSTLGAVTRGAVTRGAVTRGAYAGVAIGAAAFLLVAGGGFLLGSGSAVLPVAVLPVAVAQEAGDVQALLDRGWYHYEEGDYDAAASALESAFAQDPSSDAILSFVERVTAARIYRMVRSEDPRMSGWGRKILELSSEVVVSKVDDPEQIQAALTDVFASEDQERLLKLIQYTAKFGRNLVPSLVPILSDTDLVRRTTAITWIARIGVDAVPVLQAARKHPDETVRRNVASLLGARDIRHVVSLATLKAFIETDPISEVKAAAEKSFNTILSDLDGRQQLLSAKEYFLQNAYEYYRAPYRNPFASTFYTPTVYKLVGEEIVAERVADFQLSDRMAQQALEEALDLDNEYFAALVLLLCNDTAQVVDYDLNVDYYQKNETQTDVADVLAGQQPYVDYVLRNRILAAASSVLYAGLNQAIDDGKPGVARKIIETIRDTNRRGRVPDAMLRALEDSNSRLVRTAAAIAIAYWNPLSDFDAGDQVVKILEDAVYASGIRTVQKIMGNQRVANRVDALFQQMNMESYSPISSVEAGYAAVISSPPDVVFMDEEVALSVNSRGVAPINFFVNELRKNYRSVNVPVVVVVPEGRYNAAKEMYESAERKVWVAPDTIDRVTLEKQIFDELFQDKDDAKARATLLAAEAGGALNYLASVPTRLPARSAVGTLIKVLANRPDEVRLPCIRALGNLRAAESASDLAVVFSRSENEKEVRVAAMNALGMALSSEKASARPDVLRVIQQGMAESDMDLRRASWFAFSNAKPTGAARLEAILAQPPTGDAAEAIEEAGPSSVEETPEGELPTEESTEEEPLDLDLDLDLDNS